MRTIFFEPRSGNVPAGFKMKSHPTRKQCRALPNLAWQANEEIAQLKRGLSDAKKVRCYVPGFATDGTAHDLAQTPRDCMGLSLELVASHQI